MSGLSNEDESYSVPTCGHPTRPDSVPFRKWCTVPSSLARRSLLGGSALALLGGGALGLAPSAGAAPARAADPLPPADETTTAPSPNDLIEVQDLSSTGQVLSTTTYDGRGRLVVELPDGTLVRSAAEGSGSGGSSSASGCRKATVKNRGESITGTLVYKYNTWTEWCWNRADHAVTTVKTGQYLSDVASTMYYRGLTGQDERFYAWRSGFNKSGHWHERQAHFENCVVRYGCISSDYPRNVIRAHSDGTYTWAAFD